MKHTALLLLCAFTFTVSHAQTLLPQGWRTECVGYHQVDVPGEVEAATEPVTSNAYSQIGGGEFSESLRVMEDGFNSGELTVEVSHPSTREEFERYIPRKMYKSKIDGRDLLPTDIRYAKDEIKGYTSMIADLENDKSIPKNDAFHQAIQDYRRIIANYEAQIKAWESIPEIWIDKDSYYYDGWLWLWRAPRIFRIRLNKEAIPNDKTRQELTLAVLPRFQTRALGEIPAGPGFCVPYGFVKGVSKLPYRSQTTMRMKDEPGLLYTVRFESDRLTGVVGQIGYVPETRAHRPVREAARLGSANISLTGWRAAPFKETKLPNGRYRVEMTKNGKPEVIERDASQGEVFALRAEADGAKGDPLRPAVLVMFTAFSFNADPVMKDRPVKPLEEVLPGFRQFLGSVRMREENVQAFGAKK